MVASIYDEALRRLLIHEGGYSNHPSDPGGPTNFGITIFDYRKYVKPDANAADVRAMKVAEAKAIYRAKYWDAQRCDELPAGVDYALFDYGVNSGIGRSGKVLRRVLDLSDASSAVTDGVIACAKAADARQLIAVISDERLRFLQSLRTWPVFGAGWGRRVAEVRAAALAMSAGVTTVVADTTHAPGRGAVPLDKGAQKGSAGGIAAAGAAVAGEAQRSGADPTAIIVIVAVTAALAAAGWLFWRWRQSRRQEAAVPAFTQMEKAP